jgi:hypothetical protein
MVHQALHDAVIREPNEYIAAIEKGAADVVLAAIGQMSIGAWQDFALWIFGIYAGAKTVTSSVSLLKRPAPTTASGFFVPSPRIATSHASATNSAHE